MLAAMSEPKARASRTCVGCGQGSAREDVRRADARLPEQAADRVLVRLVLGERVEGRVEIAVDTGDGQFGRGVYVHGVPRCVSGAVRGLPRAAKGSVTLDGKPITELSLRAAISAAYERRIASLLLTAKRAKKLEVGSDAVTAVCRADKSSAGKGALVFFATDAAQAADLSEVRRAVRESRGFPWATKARLGDVLGRRDVGVVAITDTRIAAAAKESFLVAAALASPSAPAASILDSGAARVRVADSARGMRSPDRGSNPESSGQDDSGVRGARDSGGNPGAVE
jgi:hypothetical protein